MAAMDNPLRYPSLAESTTEGWNAYIGPGRARVTPPSMLDVQPYYEGEGQPYQPLLSNEEQQWLDIYNALVRSGASQAVLDYHMAQNPNAALGARIEAGKRQAPLDADIIMRAILARQSIGRSR